MRRVVDFSRYPIRQCQSLHFCQKCGKDILLGQLYFDGMYGRRAHVECLPAPEKAPAPDLVGELVEALEALGSNYPDGLPCFCEMRANNPMVGRHSSQCQKARAALARVKEQSK